MIKTFAVIGSIFMAICMARGAYDFYTAGMDKVFTDANERRFAAAAKKDQFCGMHCGCYRKK